MASVSIRQTSWVYKLRLQSTLVDLKSPELYRCILSEFVATFMLMFFSSVVDTQDPDQGIPMVSVVRVSLATGLMIATLIWAFSGASGAHVNPAVTGAFFVTRRLSLARAICYVGVQCLASIMAVALVRVITPIDTNPLLGLLIPNPKISDAQASVMEAFMTFNLCFLIISTQDPGRTKESGSRPLAIGICVTTNILIFGPLTGGSMNPIRCLGPAVITGKYEHHWIYWGPTILGGIVGALFYDLIMSSTASYKRVHEFFCSVNYDPERRAHPTPKPVGEHVYMLADCPPPDEIKIVEDALDNDKNAKVLPVVDVHSRHSSSGSKRGSSENRKDDKEDAYLLGNNAADN